MVALAARYALPAIYPVREFAAKRVTLWLNRALAWWRRRQPT
jgi:hypothetical protein